MLRWRRWRAHRLDPRGELGLLPAERLVQHHLHVASTPRRPRDEPRLRTPRPGPPRLARLGSMRRREGHSSHCNCCSAAPCPSERRRLLPLLPFRCLCQLSKQASARLGGSIERSCGVRRTADRGGRYGSQTVHEVYRGVGMLFKKTRGRYAPAAAATAKRCTVDQTKRGLRKRGKRSGDARERLEHPHDQYSGRVDGQDT